MPRNIAGNPIRPDEWNRNDGFSPGQKIVTKVPGLDTPGRLRQTRAPCRSPTSSARTTRDQPSSCSTPTRGQRHLIWSELDANPADPADVNLIIRPAVNFDEGGALHRRPAQPEETRTGKIDQGRSSRSASTATGSKRPTPPSRRAARTWSSIFATLQRAGHRAQQPLPRLGLHGRERAQPVRARALHPRRRLRRSSATTTSPTCRSQGTRAARSRSSQVTDYTRRREDDADRAQGRGHLRRAVLPERGRAARPASRFAYAAGLERCRSASPATRRLANFTCLIPRVAVDGAQVDPARPSLYGHGLLGSAERGHGREHQGDGERAQLRVLRHRLDRHVDAGRAEHRARSSATCRTSPRSPTAPSRGS